MILNLAIKLVEVFTEQDSINDLKRIDSKSEFHSLLPYFIRFYTSITSYEFEIHIA